MRTFKIGRHQNNDIIIRDESVSRHHGEITCTDDGRFYLTDLDSTNGTYVNDGHEWSSIEQTYVEGAAPVMIGDFETTLEELLGEELLAEIGVPAPIFHTNPPPEPMPSVGPAPVDGDPVDAFGAVSPPPDPDDPGTIVEAGNEDPGTIVEGRQDEPGGVQNGNGHHGTLGSAALQGAAAGVMRGDVAGAPPGASGTHRDAHRDTHRDTHRETLGDLIPPPLGPSPREQDGGPSGAGHETGAPQPAAARAARLARGDAAPRPGRAPASSSAAHVADESGLKPALWGVLGILVLGFVGLAGWVGYRYFTGETPQATAQKSQQPVAPKPLVTWNRTFGGDREDSGRSVRQTGDGGYILAGQTASKVAGGNAKGGLQGWLVRLDPSGATVWERTFGGPRADRLNFARETGDGGFIATGETLRKGKRKFDLWALKVDSQGAVEWEKFFGGKRWDAGLAVQPASDGGFVIAGTAQSKGKGRRDAWVMKLDAAGKTVWENTLGGRRDDALTGGFSATTDGGFIGAGWTASKGKGRRDLWVFKLDAAGKLVWDKTFGGTRADSAAAIRQTADDGYVVAGYTESKGAGKRDIWVLKLDATGRLLWDRTFGATGKDDTAEIVLAGDGGFLLAGTTDSGDPDGVKTWLLRLDQNGDQLWERRYPAADFGTVRSAAATADGGFILAGATKSGAAKDAQLWVMKLNKTGELVN